MPGATHEEVWLRPDILLGAARYAWPSDHGSLELVKIDSYLPIMISAGFYRFVFNQDAISFNSFNSAFKGFVSV